MKKFILSILLLAVIISPVFAREDYSITVGGYGGYSLQKKALLGAEIELKKNAFVWDFNVGSNNTLFKNNGVGDIQLSLGTYFGGLVYRDKMFAVGVLGGADFAIAPRTLNSLDLTPMGRVMFEYTLPFNLDLRVSANAGYKIDFIDSTKNGFDFKARFTLSYSFDLMHSPTPYDPKYNEVYARDNLKEIKVVKGNVVSVDGDDEVVKLRDKVKKLENDIATLLENGAEQSPVIQYVAVETENKLTDKELLKQKQKENRVSINGEHNFSGIIAKYVFEKTSVFDVFLTPMNITDIILEKEENVVDIILGNPAQWICEIKDAPDEFDDVYTHIFMRPNNINIDTDCTILTDKRTYYLHLYSTRDTYMTALTFTYPITLEKALNDYRRSHNITSYRTDGSVMKSVDDISVNVNELNFNYKIDGKNAITPKRVYSDSERTYIQFDNEFYSTSILPLVYLEDRDGSLNLLNFSIKGITYTIPLIIENGQYLVLIQENETPIKISREQF